MIAFNKPDGRGWVGIACFTLVIVILAMIWFDRTLLRDDYFKTIGTALIITAWLNGPVGWAYQATKGGGDAAASSARIAEQAATAALPPVTDPDKPQEVKVVNEPDAPVPTTTEEPKP